MEILVLHPGALGDIILSLPALGLLREQWRDAHITLAANTDFAGAVASGYADRILSLAILPLHRLYDLSELPQEDVRFWRSYDRIVSWTGSGSVKFTARLAAVNPCIIVSGWRPEPAEPLHVTRLFVRSLRPWFPLPAIVSPPRVKIDAAARQPGADWLRERGWDGEQAVVAIHPGAGAIAKRWPLECFRELARQLSSDTAFLAIEGPAEAGLGSRLVSGVARRGFLASSLSLELLVSILTHCRAFVGNDSGISHLAAALEVPAVVLFGPTLPQHWAPLGPRVSVIRLSEACPACSGMPHGGHKCMERIPLETVWKRLNCVLPPGVSASWRHSESQSHDEP